MVQVMLLPIKPSTKPTSCSRGFADALSLRAAQLFVKRGLQPSTGAVGITLVPTVLKPLLGAENLTSLSFWEGQGEEKGLLWQLCFPPPPSQSLLHLATIQIHPHVPKMELL